MDRAAYILGEMKDAQAFVRRALVHSEQLGGDRGVGFLAEVVGRNMARLHAMRETPEEEVARRQRELLQQHRRQIQPVLDQLKAADPQGAAYYAATGRMPPPVDEGGETPEEGEDREPDPEIDVMPNNWPMRAVNPSAPTRILMLCNTSSHSRVAVCRVCTPRAS